MGVFVALVELPCTGAVYLAILSLLSLSGVTGSAISFLLLYNIIFVLPLILIVFLVYQGANTDFLEDLRKKHRHLMRAVIGLTLLGLGGWMIWFAQNQS
jgi:cytochrome c biogenesis protein CcdA